MKTDCLKTFFPSRKILFILAIASLTTACDSGIQFSNVPDQSTQSTQPVVIVNPPAPEPPPVVITPPPAPEPPPVVITPPPAPEPPPAQKVTQSFAQETSGGSVDILVVIDNSASMDDVQTKVGSRFGNLISSLNNVDWQMGFINTDPNSYNNYNGPVPGWAGKLYNLEGSSGKILKKGNSNAENIFLSTIDRSSDDDSCGDIFNNGICPTDKEQPLRTMIQAVQQKNGYNQGFFRDNAGLAIIVLSDEDEMSDGPAEATKPQEVIDTIKSVLGPNKNFGVYGMIIQPGDQSCLDQQDYSGGYFGTHVQELSGLTDGLTGSICDSDYSQAMNAISERMKKHLLVTSVELSSTPKTGSLEVTFIPAASIAWTLSGKTITFAEPPPEGTQIQVTYEVQN